MILVLALSFLVPSTGDTIAWGDLDGDGLADALVVDAAGRGRLFQNLGDGGFEELPLGLDPALLLDVRLARWEDVDRDGLTDLLIAPGGELHLLRNLGGVLDDVTAYAGLDADVGTTRSVDCLDYDADGLPDLQLAGDGGGVLLHNLGDARFARVDLPWIAGPVSCAPAAEAVIALLPTSSIWGACPLERAVHPRAPSRPGARARSSPRREPRLPAAASRRAPRSPPAPPPPRRSPSARSACATRRTPAAPASAPRARRRSGCSTR